MASRTVWLTCVAMLAFAANSLLCRIALERELIDAASFGAIRLASGALVLFALARHRRAGEPRIRSDWLAASMLFAYVALFSFAYLSLSAGTGALILFGAVQLTMFAAGLRAAERFGAVAWLGFAVALAGLVYLVSPGITAPSPGGAAAMAGAGVAWGVYSLRGRKPGDPLATSAVHFMRAAPLAIALNLLLWFRAHAEPAGVVLAVASGALTSGLGYVVWYAALKGLTAMRAATVQLSVPPIAAIGGVLLLSETVGMRLVVSSIAVLGGIALVLASRSREPAVVSSSATARDGESAHSGRLPAESVRCDHEPMIATRLLRIRGQVQGVGYRASFTREARRRDLAGWVRNRHDGSVEALLHGDAHAVDEVIAWARRGPPSANVTRVEVEDTTDGPLAGHAGFRQRPTE